MYTATINIRVLLSISLLSMFTNAEVLQSGSDDVQLVRTSISNHGKNKNQPYVAAGDRTYLIGTQDGNFPDMGHHVPGEMGGLWLHPIKLIDGFWVSMKDVTTGFETPLLEAAEFINYPHGNLFKYNPVLNGVEIERFQFCPDGQQGMVVRYVIRNSSNRKRTLKFRFALKTDLSPVWLSERLEIKDARDSVAWDGTKNIFTAWDVSNNWFTVWGAVGVTKAQPILNPILPQQTAGNGTAVASQYDLSINERSSATLTFVIAGSATEKDEALRAYEYLAKNHTSLLTKKEQHYAAIIERVKITIPDTSLQEVYNWVKINTEWLVRDVPGIGRGLGGGFMEYPWWFGTETYSLQAIMAAGDFELAKQTLRLLNNHSVRTNGNGRIVHEVTTNGAVYNPGNTQETAQFILTVGKLFEWTGDLDFIREMYPAMKMGINWLVNEMDQNKNLFPEGYGIMEVYGLNAELIDVAVYTQQALEATARIAGVLGEFEQEKEYMQRASTLKTKINELFWDNEEGSYCDFYGNKAQAISATEGAITQVKLKGEDKLTERDKKTIVYYERLKKKFSELPDTTKGWFTNKNWVIATPMETGIAPREKAIPLLDKIRQEHVGEYGPYLSAVEQQAMMTISTGVQAVAECNYGRTDEALWYVHKIVETFNRRLPGSISEMMPDYGCFTIAWTNYGIIVPLIQHIFGVRPDAFNRSVIFEPHMPSGWENVNIENLAVGNNRVSFARAKTRQEIEYTVSSEQNEWVFTLKLKELPGAKYFLNGKAISFVSSGIRMSGKNNRVLVAQ